MTRIASAYRVGLAMTACLAGCASPQISHLRFGSKRVPAMTRSAAFVAAQQVLVELGYRLSRVDAESGTIATEPTFPLRAALAPDTRSRLSSTRRERRFVELRIVDGAPGASLHCRVAIEQLTTEAHRMFRHESVGADIPNQTAIDLDAASTPEQAAVWKIVRRDRSAERQILNAVAARAASPNG